MRGRIMYPQKIIPTISCSSISFLACKLLSMLHLFTAQLSGISICKSSHVAFLQYRNPFPCHYRCCVQLLQSWIFKSAQSPTVGTLAVVFIIAPMLEILQVYKMLVPSRFSFGSRITTITTLRSPGDPAFPLLQSLNW